MAVSACAGVAGSLLIFVIADRYRVFPASRTLVLEHPLASGAGWTVNCRDRELP